MKNSVGESRHVGHLIIHFKSIYSHAINSFIVQIHAHMQIYIYIYIFSQIELEMGIESQRTDGEQRTKNKQIYRSLVFFDTSPRSGCRLHPHLV